MREEILDIAKKLYHNHLTIETGTNLLLGLFSVSTRFLVRYIENGILEVEHTTYIYAKTEEEAIDKFWKFHQNEAYLDILDVNVC